MNELIYPKLIALLFIIIQFLFLIIGILMCHFSKLDSNYNTTGRLLLALSVILVIPILILNYV